MRFRNLAIVSIALAGACIARAQDTPTPFSGSGHPLTLKADGLSDNFHALQLKSGSGGGNGMMDMLMSPLMMIMGALGAMGGQSSDTPPMALITAIDLVWTTGEMQTYFGQSYLVAYKLDADIESLAKTKDITTADLRLQFIRTDSITSIIPRPDITPAVYMKMLKTPLPKPATPTTTPSDAGGGGGSK